MKSVRWMVSYILVAVVGLWLAFAVSMKFMTPAHSQEAPPTGELPPEFMQEVENTQVPPPAAQPAQVPAEIPPPPPENQIPPEAPPEAQFVGDGMTAPLPVPIIPEDDYVYDPTGKRDPFKPWRPIIAAEQAGEEKKEVILEPLQRYEIEKLQIMGILWDVRTPRAMIRDPDGGVHTVLKNAKIGRNEGYVAVIREGEIVVVETRYEDGKPVKEPRIIEFRK